MLDVSEKLITSIQHLTSSICFLMMLTKFHLVVLLLLLSAFQVAAQQEYLPELVRRIKPSVVSIVTYDAKGDKLSRGSGFFTAPDRVVTNRHVLEGAF